MAGMRDDSRGDTTGRLPPEMAEHILDQMGEAFVLLDHEFRLIELNQAALEIDRRPREELLGRTLWELAPGLQDSAFGAVLRRAMAERRPETAEHLQTWPDGHEHWVEARLAPIPSGLAIFYRDIDGRRRADDALRASEELNRRILQSSTDCIKVLSLDGRLEFMSEGGVGVMEVDDLQALIGRPWAEFWPEAERDKVLRAVEAGAAGQAMRFRGQAPTAKGNLRWWDVAVSPIEGRDGRPERLLSISRDITAAQAAETQLAETTRRLDAILNNTKMAVFLMDDRQHCVFANAAAEALTGYSFAEMQGRPLHDVVHHTRPDGSHYPLEECPIDRAFPARAQTQGEELFVAPDGSFYPVGFTASPVLDEAGRPIGTVIEARNIAEEKERQAELRETAERYRLVARATRDAIWDWDLQTHQVLWNDAVRHAFGYAEDQVGPDADWWIEHIHPDDRERVAHSIHAVIDGEGQVWSDEYRFLTADGDHVHVLDRGYVIRDASGQATRMIGAMLDLTERRRAEALLRESSDRFRAAVGAVQGILWTNDAQGRMTGEQPGWSALTGQSQAEYEGYGWAGAVHPDDAGPTIEAWEAAVAERRMFAFEHRVRRHDGQWRRYSIRAVPAFEPGGEIREWVGVHTDITEQRAAEASLRELNETLEQRVEQAVAEREAAQDALRQAQKMEAVGQLTGGIAHDFNNLLTVVVGNIDLALRSLQAAGGEPRAERALTSAQKGAERAAALTQRLLAFSRRQPLDPRPLDVDKLVLGMSDLLHRSLGETVRLEIVTSPGLWKVEADPNQLESALLNLAVNARDAMPGGGALTIETANARLDEAYSLQNAEVPPGQYVCIAVTDTGFGMPRELLEKVFEPFFTTKEVGKGTGLGLSMVYGFVKQSGGHVKLYSEEGRGTTVRMYLPRLLAEAEPQPEPEPTRGLEISRAAETILVVEDDDDVRAYTVSVLRDLGYRVLEAHDGASALRLLERQDAPVELLFTDVVMPGMSGRELAEEAVRLQPDLKVLYTSGYTRNAIVHGGRLDPGGEMITKPFTTDALAQKVRDMMDRGRTGRVLIVAADPFVRALVGEALSGLKFTPAEAASSAEALAAIRSTGGRLDVVVFDGDADGRLLAAFLREARALQKDLPIVLATSAPGAEVRSLTEGDPCAALIVRPYTGASLRAVFEALKGACG